MSVDVVAVDVNPTIWAAFCEECDAYVSGSNQDGKLVQQQARLHQEICSHKPTS